MPYGHKSGDVRVFEYGVPRTAIHHGLLTGEDRAIQEMRGQVRLWNRLVEIEIEHRRQKVELLAAYPFPPSANGHRPRRALPEDAIAALHALDRLTTDAVNVACRESDLYSWHYTDVKLRWLAARAKPDAPRFHRWDGNEHVRTWLPGGMPVNQLATGNTLFRLVPGNRDGDALVHLRIASDDQHHPIWMVLPIRLHRPLPPDGLVRCVTAQREMLAAAPRWMVLITVESMTGWQTYQGPRSGSIALDIGWRKLTEGLRIAVWQDDSGATGQILLPLDYLASMQHVEALRSERDLAYNAVLAGLRVWVREHQVPEWLGGEAKSMHSWRRKGRLVHLMRWWRGHRFDGDAEGFGPLEIWLRQDTRQWEEEANLRDKLLADRRERYRVFAAGLVRHYEEVILEDLDLSKLAVVKVKHADGQIEAGAGAEMWDAARWQRQMAGCYMLRQAIVNACEREGVRVTKRPAAYTTVVCGECGSLERWDKARELWHTCSGCGVRWDQDSNAASTLLAVSG